MRTQTPQKRVQFACALRMIILGVFAVCTCLTLDVLLHSPPTSAATSSTLNFQARLETSAGAIVPDGNYNVEFKLYSASSGGTAEWTEDYTYNSGAGGTDARLRIVNGYLTVNLGALCAFTTGTCQGYGDTAPNWNQQQWLTMNIGGTGTTGSFPTMGDGEMNPRIQLTAVPYAFTSGSISSIDGSGHTGTLSFPTSLTNATDTITLPDASGTVCLQAASACGFATGNGSAFLQGGNSFGAQAVLGTNDGNSLAVRTSGTNRIVIDTSGNLQFLQTSTINIAPPASAGAGLQLTVKGGDANGSGNAGGTLLLQGGAGGGTAASGTVLVKSNGNNSPAAFQVQNVSSANLFTVDTSNTAIVLGNDGTTSALTVRGGAATASNTAGTNITFDASNGTGNGGSGDFIFRTAPSADVTVTLDNSMHADDSSGSQVTSLTIPNFTVSTHSNRLMLVSISTYGTNAVSSVKFGTTNLNPLDAQSRTDGMPGLVGAHLELWYVLAPPIQTANVVITTATGTHISAGVASYYNVNQVTPTDVNATGYSLSPTSVTVTTNTSQLVFDTLSTDSTLTGSNTAGATVRWTDSYVTVDAAQDMVGLSGSTTMGWKFPNGSTQDWIEMAIVLSPPPNVTPDTLADRLHITATGNIGINNASPQYTLDVTGKGNFTTSLFAPQLDTATTTALSIGTVNASAITLGNTTNNILTTINGTALVKPTTGHDSATAFQVQKAAGAQVFGVDTSAAQVLFGAANSLAGKLVLYNASNANTVAVTTGTTSASYTLTLPTAVGSSGQCLQATNGTGTLGWANCTIAGTTTVTLVPEYVGAVLSAYAADGTTSGANNGSMQADHVAGLSAAQGYKHSFYEWTTSQATAQDYHLILEYQLPSNFTSFNTSSWKLWTYADSLTNTNVQFTLYNSSNTVCAATQSALPGSAATWQQISLTNPGSGCSFAANDIVTMDIKMTAISPSTNYVKVGELQFSYN